MIGPCTYSFFPLHTDCIGMVSPHFFLKSQEAVEELQAELTKRYNEGNAIAEELAATKAALEELEGKLGESHQSAAAKARELQQQMSTVSGLETKVIIKDTGAGKNWGFCCARSPFTARLERPELLVLHCRAPAGQGARGRVEH